MKTLGTGPDLKHEHVRCERARKLLVWYLLTLACLVLSATSLKARSVWGTDCAAVLLPGEGPHSMAGVERRSVQQARLF